MKSNKFIKIGVVSLVSVIALQACVTANEKQSNETAKSEVMVANNSAKIEQRVSELLAKMTLQQKVGQMLQPEIRSITPEQVKQYHIGSILNGGGAFPQNNKYASIQDWVALADEFYWASMDKEDGRLAIPVIWGTDAVHGHNNVLGATLFPHNIGLGAANNPALIEKIGQITAKEVAVTGIDWTFAPTLAVVRDDRWGRTYESYSEHPDIVKEYAKSMVNGIQGVNGSAFNSNHILATAKHFIGDGGTQAGDDQGNTLLNETELFNIHGQGYFSALDANVQTVMVSYSSLNGEKMHGQKYLISEVLKKQMGFDGIVVSDWNGIGQVSGCANDDCAAAINAGIDLFMVPDTWQTWITNTIEQVNKGLVPMARIDDAVTRILRVKLRTGLFDAGAPSTRELAGNSGYIGNKEHRDIAKQAVRESLVLLKNNHNILPLKRNINVLVAGEGANNIAMQTGGWTLSWQGDGNTNADFPGATSIYQGIKNTVEAAGGSALLSENGHYDKKPDVAIVVIGEQPYTEFLGDIQNLQSLEFEQQDKKALAMLQSLQQQGIPTVTVLLSGRPLWVNKEINSSDAFVAAWLPGSEGEGIAEVLFKNEAQQINYDFTGRLSFSWPADACQTSVNVEDDNYQPQFQYGYGLTYQENLAVNKLSENGAYTLGCQLTAEDLHKELQPLVIDLTEEQWQVAVDSYAGKHSFADANGVITNAVSVSALTNNGETNVKFNAQNAGSKPSTVSIRNIEEINLLPFLAKKGMLNWKIRVDEAIESEVKAKIDCGMPCSGEVDITELIKSKKVGQWQEISIDLQCYVPGTDLRKVKAPLVLSTNGELSLSLAGGEIITNQSKTADIQCSNSV